MRYLTILLLAVIFQCSCNMNTEVEKSLFQLDCEKHRIEVNEEFGDTAESPLPVEQIVEFKGLNYYDYKEDFRIESIFSSTEADSVFKMKTTTDRLPEYRRFGTAKFTVNDEEMVLHIYQNVKLVNKEGYEDYLFIPFKDMSNGEFTYGGGRFLDVRIPEGDTLILDFNYSYNPYCAYNSKYSCPIPPTENHLSVSIEAGEKKYKDH